MKANRHGGERDELIPENCRDGDTVKINCNIIAQQYTVDNSVTSSQTCHSNERFKASLTTNIPSIW